VHREGNAERAVLPLSASWSLVLLTALLAALPAISVLQAGWSERLEPVPWLAVIATWVGIALGRAHISARAMVALGLLVVGGVFVHVGVFLHAIVFAATVLLLGGCLGIGRANRHWIGWMVAAAAALALALRLAADRGTVNVIHRHVQGVMFVGERWMVMSPMEILRQHGMLFLGGLAWFPVLLVAARKRPDARAIVAACALPIGMAFIPPVATALFERGSYMAFRSLLNAPVFPGIVVAVSCLVAGARARGFAARLAGSAVLIAWALVFVRPVPGAWLADARERFAGERQDTPWVSDECVRSVSALPTGCTILSDPATSYVLSAYTAHRFVSLYQQHANPYDPYALDRLRAVRDALSPYAVPDVALVACRRYDVDYVLINRGRESGSSDFLAVWSPAAYEVVRRRLESMGGAFALVDSFGGSNLYRFEPAAPVNRAWSIQDQPVVVGSPVLEACAPRVPADVFRVTGISVVPTRVLPGDTVVVTLGYRRDGPSPFDLPMLIHLRFDHESVPAHRRYPGEKMVRRAAERRTATVERFRADFRPGHGVLEPDLWPIGTDLCESFTLVLPQNLRLGRYRIEVGIVRDSLLPNFHAVDLLYNRDHYSGTACAQLVVADRITGEIDSP